MLLRKSLVANSAPPPVRPPLPGRPLASPVPVLLLLRLLGWGLPWLLGIPHPFARAAQFSSPPVSRAGSGEALAPGASEKSAAPAGQLHVVKSGAQKYWAPLSAG